MKCSHFSFSIYIAENLCLDHITWRKNDYYWIIFSAHTHTTTTLYFTLKTRFSHFNPYIKRGEKRCERVESREWIVSVVRTWKVVYHRYILVQRFILKIYMRFHSFIKHMIYFYFLLICFVSFIEFRIALIYIIVYST